MVLDDRKWLLELLLELVHLREQRSAMRGQRHMLLQARLLLEVKFRLQLRVVGQGGACLLLGEGGLTHRGHFEFASGQVDPTAEVLRVDGLLNVAEVIAEVPFIKRCVFVLGGLRHNSLEIRAHWRASIHIRQVDDQFVLSNLRNLVLGVLTPQ